MPALIAFGRKWSIGSDDFVFPGVCLFCFRLACLIVIVAAFSHQHDAFACPSGRLLQAFYFGMLVLLPMKIILNALLVYHSARGRILNFWERKNVPRLLYLKLVLLLAEIGFISFATYWAYDDSLNCDWPIVLMVRVLTVITWSGVVIFFCTIGILFTPLGTDHHPAKASLIWQRRCQMLCCSFTRDENTTNVYREVADLVSSFFEGLDLVPTDIAAGLLLVSQAQGKRHSRLTSVVSDRMVGRSGGDRNEAVNVTSSGDLRPQAWMNMTRAARFMRFSLGIYGWPMYSLMHLPFGCCGLLCMGHEGALPFPTENVPGDNCFKCNTSALRRTLTVSDAEIFYTSFSNNLFENPFALIRDHQQKAVVVVIRGTLSLKDSLVDMTALGEPIGEGFSPSCLAHKGMMRSARFLRSKLIEMGLLERAFAGQCESYKLVICGHSLGAGVAAILAMLMKSQYPTVQCFAFSPPGGLLSLEAAQLSEDFVLSVVVGDDLVPRLGIQTMEDLKINVIGALTDYKFPKYKLFTKGFCRMLKCRCLNVDLSEPTTPLIGSGMQPSYAGGHTGLVESLTDAVASCTRSRITQPVFYPPGTIMYIVPSHDNPRACCGKDMDYFWRWAERTEFLEIKVNARMAADHMPDLVLSALEHLLPDAAEASYSPETHS